MRRAWVSLAVALLLGGCGQGSGGWLQVSGTVTAGGVELIMVGARVDDQAEPWRHPPAGKYCAVYTVRVRSVDGGRHELRPEDFAAGGKSEASAVAFCNSPQLEPVWIGSQSKEFGITILEGDDAPAPLFWHPRG